MNENKEPLEAKKTSDSSQSPEASASPEPKEGKEVKTKPKHKLPKIKASSAINFIRGKHEPAEEVYIEFNENKKRYSTDKLARNKARETLKMAEQAWLHYKRKFWRSYGLLVGMNLLIVIISSLMIVLNLYALRWNTSDREDILYFFIAIASGSLIITLLTSISSFFSFYSKNETYSNNIEFLTAKLNEYKAEEVPDLHAFVNEIGKVDTDF